MADTVPRAVPDFYQAATSWHHTRCAECDGRGYFRSGDRWRSTCQTCAGEGTVPVPALPFYQPLENFQPLHRKPKTMAETPLPRGFSATCPCCHGQGFLLVATPCAHCEETGRVQAEVDERPTQTHDPAVIRAIAAEVDASCSCEPRTLIGRWTTEYTDITPMPAAPTKHARSPKTPKRSRRRTRDARHK